jgi:hypothetical protein
LKPTLACAIIVFGSLLLPGCSGPQVRSVGSGGGALVFELRGSDIAAIDAEAARLCTRGYDVLRQSMRYSPPQPSDDDSTRWLQQVGDWLSGMPGNQAQATVQCRG